MGNTYLKVEDKKKLIAKVNELVDGGMKLSNALKIENNGVYTTNSRGWNSLTGTTTDNTVKGEKSLSIGQALSPFKKKYPDLASDIDVLIAKVNEKIKAEKEEAKELEKKKDGQKLIEDALKLNPELRNYLKDQLIALES